MDSSSSHTGKNSFFSKSKKGGKNVSKPPPPLSKVTAPGPGGQPSGGHIIPPTDITILDKELGRGEFGKVMQGVWSNGEGGQIPVAVKCLSPDKLSLDKCQQDFLKEAAIMHSLNHEHLVKLYGVVLDVNSSLMLVTEFAPLRSLAENIKQEALKPAFPISLLLDFSVQIADAMRYLHTTNIIHRDLAARNILLFVDDQGNKKAKISDFGLSRRLLLGENYRSEMRPNLKLPLAWMPVESLTKLTFTKASDVWSFGVTMWEMFSYGRQPWTTLSGEEILKTIDKPRLERLERPEACPLKIYELMNKCWAHEPESRMSFSELCEELPKVRPSQVKAMVNCTALHPEELSFRAEDVISVIDANEETGVWKGINPMGKIGYFQRGDTVAVGSAQMGKLKRWRSGRSSKTENRRSKLSLDDISKPKDYKHIFHVGVDGKVEGDPTFGGDYRNIPKSEEEEEGSSPSRSSSGRSDSKSSTPSKSPAKSKKNNNNKRNVSSPVIELSKETILPPPNGFDSGSTVSVPDVIPSVSAQQSSAPPPSLSTKEALPPPLSSKAPIAAFAEPELTYTTNGSSSHSNRDAPPKTRDGGKSSTVSSPEDLSLPSTFEMGSLLDDMMSVWDSAKLNLGFSDSLETTPEETEEGAMADEDDSQSLLEGEENALCNGDASLSPSINRVGEVNPVAVEPVSVVQAVQEQEAGASRNAALVGGVEGAEEERGAVGGAGGAAVGGAAVVSKGAEGGLLPGSIIIKDTMTKPTKTYRKAPRQPQNGSAETNGGVVKPDSQPPEPPQAARSRPGRDMNIAKQMSRDKRWDNEFKRLSSTSPKDQSLENDYIDTQNMQQRQSRSSEEYEELALASSPQPYTLRDSVLDSANVQRVTRCPPDVVTRSISMRTARPNVEALQAQASAELSRSRSLREPPISPLGQEAYDSLVGGAICSNQQRPRLESEEKRAPAVPPKPAPKPPSRSKSLQSSSSRNSDVRSSGSGSYRSYSGASSDDATSEDAASSPAAQGELPGNRGAVASLRQRFNSNPDATVPPRPPPREPSDVKVSTFTGVRLRRREQSNGMSESYYASEHENNNATPASIKINSPPTASGLEHQLPRRTRRSVGEDRIRRRSSSDASDSDTEAARPGSGSDRLGLAAGSRASEGDSSSDETLASPKRLSSSSNERSAFSVERDAVSGYRSPPRPLYDLPEDQTNSNSLRPSLLPPPPPLPPHLSDDTPTMESTPPPLPPRVTASPAATPRNPLGGPARDIHWTRPPDNGNPDPPSALDTPLYSVPPPRPHPRDFYKRLPRSKTVDIGEHERHSQYDSLPVRRPEWSPERSRSMDVVDVNEDYMVGSAAGIRELLQQGSALSKNNSNCDVVDGNGEEDDLHDMPDSSPPPVPTKHNPFIDSTYGEIPFKKQTQHPQENAMPPQRCSIRDADYMIMKPQTDSDLKREYSQLSSAQTDYAVVPVLSSTNIPRGDSNHKSSATSTSNENVAPSIDQGSDKDKALYHRMHPARVKAKSKDSSTFNFLRTKSAHLLRRPAFLLKTRPPRPKRRGTVSTASLLRSGDQDGGSSSLPRSGDQQSGGGQADTHAHGMRRSRSFDDILQDQDWTMPQEAESLQDLLARASISPGERHSQPDPRSGYLVPPSARRKAPLLPSPEARHLYQTPPSRSSSRSSPSPPPPPHSQQGEGEGEGEAAYLDMSQASLERRKNKHKKVTSTQSHPASNSPSSNRSRPVSTSPSSNRPTHSLSPGAASTAQPATSTPDHSPVLHPSSANRIKPVPGSLPEPAAAVCRIALYSPNDDEVDL